MAGSEIEARADFSQIRYAQCWEDADILLEGLDIRPGDNCLAVASAGDNAFAMLTRDPALVMALDLNPVQLYCLELRAAAYAALTHAELLMLMGSRACAHRPALYQRCRSLLAGPAAAFWDERLPLLERFGLGGVGKFERYFRLFKDFVLPLCHGKSRVQSLFTPKSADERREFFENQWCNLRWKALAGLFFSRPVLGRLGRDPAFFAYVQDSFGAHLKRRIRHALCDLPPEENPYLHWILTGTHGRALPLALRPESFEAIRRNLPRLQWRLASIEDYVGEAAEQGLRFQRFNLSNIFEYRSEENFHAALSRLADSASSGARLFYWNMLVPRSSPDSLRHRLMPLADQAAALHARDKAFFYSRVVLEEVK